MITTNQRAEGCVDIHLESYEDIPRLFEKLTCDDGEAPNLVIIRADWAIPGCCVVGVHKRVLEKAKGVAFCGEEITPGWGCSSLTVRVNNVGTNEWITKNSSYQFRLESYVELKILTEWKKVRESIRPDIDEVIQQLISKPLGFFIVMDDTGFAVLYIRVKVLRRLSETGIVTLIGEPLGNPRMWGSYVDGHFRSQPFFVQLPRRPKYDQKDPLGIGREPRYTRRVSIVSIKKKPRQQNANGA